MSRPEQDHKSFLSVYKIVSFKDNFRVEPLRLREEVQKWLTRSLNDPIVKILAKNSNLTKTQLQTLLIDILAENISGKSLKYDQKARLRLSAVSRGAFNRTLRQARRNAVQSIYTILLLGYLGVFDDTRLDPYLEISNKLQTYMKAYRDIAGKREKNESLRIINTLREELEKSLERLSRPRSISEKL